MSLDFSTKLELRGLAAVVRGLQAVAAPLGVQHFLMGAVARDLMLRYAHGIEPARATADVDVAVMVGDWAIYEALRAGLIASREFSPRPGPPSHRLRHASGMPLDVVPFGGVEGPDRKFAWPPERSTVFDCFGMSEALAASASVRLPEAVQVRVPTVPALTILKIAAWQDRKHVYPGRDAPDLILYLRRYMDCGNLERAADEHPDLFAGDDFDYGEAGARLLARDVLSLLGNRGAGRLLEALAPEADENGALLLAHQSGHDIESARRMLEVFCGELAERM
ncbi:MAG: nucleotidyl transferase AbiEii/AbiGii toxin family protein [Burkholderiales bacterium]|nr:nucleotidyl transferase AbiEii/AbiGii toxin family protein [Burkholderiales bacterium]